MTHESVLLKEVLSNLNPQKGETVIDATLGGAGHAIEISKKLGSEGLLIGIDRDNTSIERAYGLDTWQSKIILRNSNFKDINNLLDELGISKIDGIIYDLGLSSTDLEESGRGFSFMKDEPLLMTFDYPMPKEALTAYEILNKWSERDIEEMLLEYGEERFARKISQKIVEARKQIRINSTFDLVRIIEKSVPAWYKKKRIHFATRVFQAIRISVNDEIRALEISLNEVTGRLNSGGRIVVISFHSLEDRVVKYFFKQKVEEGILKIITKKPLIPTESEIKANPRARSAKVRIAVKNTN